MRSAPTSAPARRRPASPLTHAERRRLVKVTLQVHRENDAGECLHCLAKYGIHEDYPCGPTRRAIALHRELEAEVNAALVGAL